ncbi:hypothetical protein F2P81_022661 [Scophthalmus maximus]|uniref:Uncharacterized protein n=1 Tax=Scophthalmus maximus TaxID=52904 RepID=A0A6A4S291_SCOMX|nr:hypothetical protein F2P81_022661 [Scophthalmus maximus]
MPSTPTERLKYACPTSRGADCVPLSCGCEGNGDEVETERTIRSFPRHPAVTQFDLMTTCPIMTESDRCLWETHHMDDACQIHHPFPPTLTLYFVSLQGAVSSTNGVDVGIMELQSGTVCAEAQLACELRCRSLVHVARRHAVLEVVAVSEVTQSRIERTPAAEEETSWRRLSREDGRRSRCLSISTVGASGSLTLTVRRPQETQRQCGPRAKSVCFGDLVNTDVWRSRFVVPPPEVATVARQSSRTTSNRHRVSSAKLLAHVDSFSKRVVHERDPVTDESLILYGIDVQTDSFYSLDFQAQESGESEVNCCVHVSLGGRVLIFFPFAMNIEQELPASSLWQILRTCSVSLQEALTEQRSDPLSRRINAASVLVFFFCDASVGVNTMSGSHLPQQTNAKHSPQGTAGLNMCCVCGWWYGEIISM